jgi:hypothetical protein
MNKTIFSILFFFIGSQLYAQEESSVPKTSLIADLAVGIGQDVNS